MEKNQTNTHSTNFATAIQVQIPKLNLTVNAISVHLNYKPYGPYDFVFGNETIEMKKKRVWEGDVNEQGTGRLQQIDELLSDPFVKEALTKAKKGGNEALIIGGDFNEPSHLDWTEDTKYVDEEGNQNGN